MCGRFALDATPEEVRALYGFLDDVRFPARYNIPPTQPIGVVHEREGRRRFTLMRWGLVPAWVKDPGDFTLLLNARAESATEKPAFRAAMRYRRCLVPASGFYEWQRTDGRKQPYWVPPAKGGLVSFAGLWETWLGADGSEIDTACILTTAANAELAPIHDRMPAVVQPADWDLWLTPAALPPPLLDRLLAPAPDGYFAPYPVSPRVNSARNDGPELLLPLALSGETPPEKPAAKRAGRKRATMGSGGTPAEQAGQPAPSKRQLRLF